MEFVKEVLLSFLDNDIIYVENSKDSIFKKQFRTSELNKVT